MPIAPSAARRLRRCAGTLLCLGLTLAACHKRDSSSATAPPPGPFPTFLSSDVRVDSDLPPVGGASTAETACSGTNVYLAWIDDRGGGTNVFFNRSFDAGVTWMPTSVRIDGDPVSTTAREWIRIACSGLLVYVVWRDSRNGIPDIFFTRSADGGTTWAPPIQLDGGSAFSGDPDLCSTGSTVHVVWEDARNGNGDIYYNRSADGGLTWLPSDLRLDTDSPGAGASAIPRICCDGSYAYATWADRRPLSSQTDVYGNVSADGGLTWAASDFRIKTDPAGTTSGWLPVIACSGPRVYVAWEDKRNGSEDIYFNASTDGGATWAAADLRLDSGVAGSAISRRPKIGCAGTSVYVGWEDFRNGADPDIYSSASADGGATWLGSDRRLDTDAPGTGASFIAALTSSGQTVCVVWQDDRQFMTEIRFNYSTDGGVTWAASDLRLDTDPVPSAFSQSPRMAQDGLWVYVAWGEVRNGGMWEVYFNRCTP